jgi:hypothetical protein
MRRSDVVELYYITPIDNIPSILEHGILSNELAAKVPHTSLAMPEIQIRRINKKIPGAGGLDLHSYANLYFDAHNPMLSKRRERNDTICILRINPNVLDMPGVIVADRNAATDYVRFYAPAGGIESLDKDKLFAKYWTNSQDENERRAHKRLKCAEVLVPNKVEPNYVSGAYVANEKALASFAGLGTWLTVCIKNDIFF